MKNVTIFNNLNALTTRMQQDMESKMLFLLHAHKVEGKRRLSSVLKKFDRYPFNPTLLNKLV